MENTEIIETEIVEENETESTEIVPKDSASDISEDSGNDVIVYESVDYTETLAIVQQNTDYLPIIASDVRIILVLVLLSFCWSCMRAWRINSLGGK